LLDSLVEYRYFEAKNGISKESIDNLSKIDLFKSFTSVIFFFFNGRTNETIIKSIGFALKKEMMLR